MVIWMALVKLSGSQNKRDMSVVNRFIVKMTIDREKEIRKDRDE